MKNAQLDAVTKAKSAYVMARTTLESRIREQMRQELANLQTQVDIAVRIAYNNGESKAEILRALGTKDYHTLNASLERTEAVEEIVGENPLDKVYEFDGELLTVNYVNHGSASITGVAQFKMQRMVDGALFFHAVTPLWDETYTQKNHVVAALDGKQEGEYYEEAAAWAISSVTL